MYVLNITIPPIFVDNHVEPSKSAVNIQVGPLGALKSGRLITHPRTTRPYIRSSQISFKNSYSKIYSSNHPFRSNLGTNQLIIHERGESLQIIRFLFTHKIDLSNHIAPQNLITFPQRSISCSRLTMNVRVLVMSAVLVALNVCTLAMGMIPILVPPRVPITVMTIWNWKGTH